MRGQHGKAIRPQGDETTEISLVPLHCDWVHRSIRLRVIEHAR